MDMWWIMFAVATAVIVPLALYAWSLMNKVREKNQERQAIAAQANEQWQKHQSTLLADVRFIAKAVHQEQCDVTEGVLRLHHLISRLDETLWAHPKLEAIRHYHSITCDMPYLNAYKQLSRKEQHALDKKRLQLEKEHLAPVSQACQFLLEHEYDITLELV